MIEIPLSTEDLTKVRIAPSPLWETVTSFGVLLHTTAELARQLDLAPAAVSAHLSRLKDAGLVEPHRNGKRVYYRLSCAGESLLRIFGETS